MLLRSTRFSSEQSASYEMLAWVEATAQEPVTANLNLVQSHFADLLRAELEGRVPVRQKSTRPKIPSLRLQLKPPPAN